MIYVIDYRNGSMGNTIIAHTLFACDKINIVDIDQIFSVNGDAHAVSMLNKTELTCKHGFDDPSIPKPAQLLSVVCKDWDEVLRKKMSYYKSYKAYPTESNLGTFGFNSNPNMDLLEYLTVTYFDSYNQKFVDTEHILHLGQYLEHRLEILQHQVKNVLGWQWDNLRSEAFHKRVLAHNHKYLLWLDSIKNIVNQTLEKNVVLCNLQFWEKAIVISMSCYLRNVHPSNLHWSDGQFLIYNNHSLIESLSKYSDVIA